MFKENKAVKLIEFIRDNYSEEDESSFWTGITILRKHTQFKDIGNDSLIELMNMLSIIKDDVTRAMLIKTIVEIPCFDFNSNQKLLDEYLHLISERYATNEEAAQCLSAFILAGADRDKIFNEIAKNLDKENSMQILVNIDIGSDYWNIIPNTSEEFFIELQRAKRIRYRSGVITSFLSIVHPMVLKYGDIAPFFYHYCDERKALDWNWNQVNSLIQLIERKIITKKEADILQRLGNLRNKYEETNPKKIEKLYNEFFEDKDLIDVIFTLPG